MKKITMPRFLLLSLALLSGFALALIALPDVAMAANGLWNGQLGFPEAVTPSAERIHSFHNLLLTIITGIVVFVCVMLVVIMIRFRAKANPTPSMTAHNTLLEIVWTVIPVVILIVIAVPSFKLLYYIDRTETPEMTLKITGHQWYWQFDYPDNGEISLMSIMIPDDEIDPEKGQYRLLSVDNPAVLPVNTNIQLIITAADVIHSFAMPSFGIKTDAVPGRLNETWIRITKEGTYYGQCSELCGEGHAFMPTEIRAVSKEEFAKWVAEQGGTMPEPVEDVMIETGMVTDTISGATETVISEDAVPVILGTQPDDDNNMTADR